MGGVWYTTQQAELTERMKRLRATNTQPDNSTLRRMEGQEMTHLRQQLREMTRQLQQKERELEKNATNHQLQSDIKEKDLQIQQKKDVIQRHEGTISQINGYLDNPSRLIEGDVTGEESKEAMLMQLNQSRELAEGVTVIYWFE